MSDQKFAFSPPDIFYAIGLIALLICVFMGCVFTFSDLKIAIVISSLSVFVVVILTHYLEVWKTKKRRANTDYSNKKPEFIIGTFYFILLIGLFVFSNHYFNIEFVKKSEIKDNITKKLNDFQSISDSYQKAVQLKIDSVANIVSDNKSRFNDPRPDLKRNARSKLHEIFTYDYSDTVAVSRAMVLYEKTKRSYYEDTAVNASVVYRNKVKSVFDNWEILNIGYYYGDINKKLLEYLSYTKAKMPDFTYNKKSEVLIFPGPFDSLTATSFFNLLLGIFFYSLVHICVLSKYIVASREKKVLIDIQTGTSIEGDISKRF